MTYRIKPLEWVDAVGVSMAATNYGTFLVTQTANPVGWVYHDGSMYKQCASRDAGKAACEKHYQLRLSDALRPSGLDERLETLAAWARKDLPEPYRKMFFDILANGKLAPWGYGEPEEPHS